MLSFVHDLLETGRVSVGGPRQSLEDVADAVRELDRAVRNELAFEPPALAMEAGEWALKILYSASQALVYREMEPQAIHELLGHPCPRPASPEVCYSADLAFRFLPDLIKLARGIAQDDPLVHGLLALAKGWPLSSVGIEIDAESDIHPFFSHPSLRMLYVDRIIERGDVARCNRPEVREAVREAIRAWPHLTPKIAAAIEEEIQLCR